MATGALSRYSMLRPLSIAAVNANLGMQSNTIIIMQLFHKEADCTCRLLPESLPFMEA